MSHFRKMLLAVAAVASFFGAADSAKAQANPYVCNTSFSPLVVRSEGLRELVGDIVVTCNGGNAVTGYFNLSLVTGFSPNVPQVIPAVGVGANAGSQLLYTATGYVAGSVPNLGTGVNLPTGCWVGGVISNATPCTGYSGGTVTVTLANVVVPAINISVTVAGTRITNRIFGTSNLTDALLFIDEPTTASTGSMISNQNPCANAGTTVGTAGVCTGQNYFFNNGTAIASGYGTGTNSNTGGTTAGNPLNVYQAQYGVGGGFVPNEQTITFVGVPVVQPGAGNGNRVYRIKNIRVQVANAFQVNGQIQAFISIQNPPANLVLNNAQGVVGFVQRGLFFDTISGGPYAQCLGWNATSGGAFPTEGASPAGGLVSTGALSFTEAYGVAFKRRGYSGGTSGAFANNSGLDVQDPQFNQFFTNNVGQANPTVNYNNESGFYNTSFTNVNSLNVAGIASNGTRLRARFSGIPAQVRLYVSAQPVTAGAGCASGTAAGRIGRNADNSSGFCIGQGTDARNAAYAIDGASADGAREGFAPLTTQAFTVNAGTGGVAAVQGSAAIGFAGPGAAYAGYSIPSIGGIRLIRVPIAADGTGVFFWEVLRAEDNVLDRFDFIVAIAFTPTTSIVTDANTSVVANASGNFAPIQATGGNGYPSVPAFALQLPEEVRPIFTITNCATNLLYPFVSSVTGFNTGIAVTNASKDPFGTVNETGICRVFFYGTTAGGGVDPTPQAFNKSVPSGQVATFNLLFGGPDYGIQPVAGFQGYIIISCNFRWAHGFAFVSDPSNLQTAHGYLALILDAAGLRRSTGASVAEALDN
ncbi:MAG: hypothetical protein K7J46_08250 [Bryobacter sp.]|jgi:hypothetical protein|nr:hypothetical protein [Bryobacter sp. CoA8 C33]